MDHKAFRRLLKKYLDNSCTEEEKRLVDRWYELLDNEYATLSEPEADELEEMLWNKIQATTASGVPMIHSPKKRMYWWRYAAAAMLLGIVILTVYQLSPKKADRPAKDSLVALKISEGLLQETNASDTVRKLQLEDGSQVTMYPGSKLAFPQRFASQKREVYLEGDAFFDISRNENRPFFVYNNQIVTQVLGTSFAIHKKNGQVEVAVKTGRVAVYENEEQVYMDEARRKSNGVIITPNQKVTYYQQERHFITALVDQPALVTADSTKDIPQAQFRYAEIPLTKVFEELEEAYELEIFLENKRIAACLFSGDLNGQSLFNKLESICLVFNATYEIKGTKILIHGGKECT